MVPLSLRLGEEPERRGATGDWGPAAQLTGHKAFVQQGTAASKLQRL